MVRYAVCFLAPWVVTTAIAAGVVVDPTAPINVGPITPYGETADETKNKRILFEFVHLENIEFKPKEAFEKYVSKDYCDHGHLATRGAKACAGYDETLASWISRHKSAPKPGDVLELPTAASVDGEMVTMYGKGVDIFRVHDGKITDHWDASPPEAENIPAHDAVFVEKIAKEVETNSSAPGAAK